MNLEQQQHPHAIHHPQHHATSRGGDTHTIQLFEERKKPQNIFLASAVTSKYLIKQEQRKTSSNGTVYYQNA
jgi:hypothetical protein